MLLSRVLLSLCCSRVSSSLLCCSLLPSSLFLACKGQEPEPSAGERANGVCQSAVYASLVIAFSFCLCEQSDQPVSVWGAELLLQHITALLQCLFRCGCLGELALPALAALERQIQKRVTRGFVPYLDNSPPSLRQEGEDAFKKVLSLDAKTTNTTTEAGVLASGSQRSNSVTTHSEPSAEAASCKPPLHQRQKRRVVDDRDEAESPSLPSEDAFKRRSTRPCQLQAGQRQLGEQDARLPPRLLYSAPLRRDVFFNAHPSTGGPAVAARDPTSSGNSCRSHAGGGEGDSSCPGFAYTPLLLQKAFAEIDRRFGLCAREFVEPSKNECRQLMNLGQVGLLRVAGVSSSVSLQTLLSSASEGSSSGVRVASAAETVDAGRRRHAL